MNADNDTDTDAKDPDERNTSSVEDDLIRLVDGMEEDIVDERDESAPDWRAARSGTRQLSSDTSNGQEPPD